MQRVIAATMIAGAVATTGFVYAANEPTTPQEWCRVTDIATGDDVTVPCYRDATTTTTTTTTTVPETSTSTTVVEATTTVPSTTEPATTTSTTTVPPSGAGFVETFDGNTGLDRFVWGVYHRDQGHRFMSDPEPFIGVNNNAWVGGNWAGDHDLDCGGANTQRQLTSTFQQDKTGQWGWLPRMDWNVSQLVYVCRDHIMSSMGDVAGFSVLWFGPDTTFDAVTEVSWDVNMTYLGPRQWIKVGVVSDSLYQSTYQTGYNNSVTVPGHVVSDVGAADLNDSLSGPDRMIVTYTGAASGGDHGGIKIGNTRVGGAGDAGSDKATRFPMSLRDNDDGTVTFTVAGQVFTGSGSFPACPCRVVFYDQNYTPDKDGKPIGHTWHWDNIVVR